MYCIRLSVFFPLSFYRTEKFSDSICDRPSSLKTWHAEIVFKDRNEPITPWHGHVVIKS